MVKKYKLFLLLFLIFTYIEDTYAESDVWVIPSGKQCSYKIGLSGGRMIRSITSDPRSFNPILAKETSTTIITSLLFDGLTRTNTFTMQVEPNLAKSWQVDKTGKIWTFKLREDVYWSDGKRFTSKDVVFTFNDLIYNPNIPNSSRDIFTLEGQKIKVETLDEFSVRFTLPVRFAPFLRSLSQDILPQHRLKKDVVSGRFNFTWGIDAKVSDVTGTGPFVIRQYLPGEKIILGRNPYYWKKDDSANRLPYLDEIVFVILPSQDTALLKFLDGELDYYSLRGEDFPILGPLQKKSGFTVYNAGAAFGSNFLTFNQNPGKNPHTNKPFLASYKLEWFKNDSFKRAIAYAIDREKITEIIYNGLGYPQFSSMSPTSGYFYNDNVKKYPYNPEKAKHILHQEGFLDRDLDGYIEDRGGNKVKFTLITVAGDATRTMIAAMVRKDLSNLGMDVNLLPLEFNNLVAKLSSTFNWEAVLIGLTGGIEPHFGKNVWHSTGHLHIWHPLQSAPHTDWEKKIDEIFEEAVQILDEKKRKELYDQWQEIVSMKLPVIYTVLSASVYAVRDRFGNLYPTVYGGPFGQIEYIYIKP